MPETGKRQGQYPFVVCTCIEGTIIVQHSLQPSSVRLAKQCVADDAAAGETGCRRDGRDLFCEPVIALEATSEGVPQDDGRLQSWFMFRTTDQDRGTWCFVSSVLRQCI